VRVHKSFPASKQANATLKKLLAAPGRARRPGALTVFSGIAQRSLSNISYLGSENPLAPGWGGWQWNIPTPPAGEVLWFTLEFASQWWKWVAYSLTNNSGHYKYADVALVWRWNLLPNPWEFPGWEPFMADSAGYEFYASEPPGNSAFTAWWVEPYKSVTLMPSGKLERDPLTLLLATERNGLLRLWYGYNISDLTFNGKEWHGAGYIDGGPETLFYSYAVVVPRAPVVEPVVVLEGGEIVSRTQVGTRESRRKARSRGGSGPKVLGNHR
jgi:hypothetical protein